MGRIADAALRLLDNGPETAQGLGERLSRSGVTRSRDPAGAVRRALRHDLRAMDLPDGRIASLTQALDGVTLTAMVDGHALAERSIPIDGDLAPLALLPVGPRVPLPEGARPGSAVAVRIDARGNVALAKPLRRAGRRPADEEALLGALRRHLRRAEGPGLASLALLVAEVAACNPQALRAPGRPLTEVLERAGFEVHLGWVGAKGTAWAAVTEAHAAALEDQALALLGAERVEESIELQQRLIALLDDELPDRAKVGRRRLARTLARHGQVDDAISTLRISFSDDDPEDRYAAAVVAHRHGNAVLARRMVEEGLARAHDAFSEAAAALSDLGGDLDDQATFARIRAELPELLSEPPALATALVTPRRSYLVEALIDLVFDGIAESEAEEIVRAMIAQGGDDGRDAALAIAAVLDGGVAEAARLAGASGARAGRPSVAGLIEAHPSAAWCTSLDDAPDQMQLIVAVAKEEDRVAPLIALIDVDELQGAVKDAFFLPDMAPARLRYEILEPMAENGLPAHEAPVSEVVELLRVGLLTADERGWSLPSLDMQPVIERVERWVLGRLGDGGPAAASEA